MRRHQTGGLSKRKQERGWVWIANWRDEAKRGCSKVLGPCSQMTKSEAQAKLEAILRPVNLAVRADTDPNMTLGGYLDGAYLPFCRRKWKESTKGTTEDRLGFHLAELRDKPLRNFTRDGLQTFLDGRAARVGFSTCDHLRWDLRAIFGLAVNDRIIPANPAEMLFTPATAKRSSSKMVMTAEQVVQATMAVPPRERAILKLAILAGMRPGEILGLKWGEVRDDHAQVVRGVYRGGISTPKTPRSIRTVAFPPGLAGDLRAWRDISRDTRPDAWVFPSERGTPLWRANVWDRWLRPQLKKVGLGWATFQVMRRTHSTLSKAAGAEPKVIADQLGHGLNVDLNVYSVTQLDQLAKAVGMLESSLPVM